MYARARNKERGKKLCIAKNYLYICLTRLKKTF